MLFGLAGLVFAEANHSLGALFKRLIPYGPARPAVGGLMVIALVYLLGTRDYLGLGVWSADPNTPTISGFFTDPVDHWSWLLKMLFTVVTLSASFKGGGNAVAHHTHYGFSNHGPVRENGADIGDPHLTMCVELIDHRDALERFCAAHGDMLGGKVIVYKHLEHWSIGPKGVAHEDATPEELAAEPDAAA